MVERLKDCGVCNNKIFFSIKKMYDVTIIQRSNVQEYGYVGTKIVQCYKKIKVGDMRE